MTPLVCGVKVVMEDFVEVIASLVESLCAVLSTITSPKPVAGNSTLHSVTYGTKEHRNEFYN